MIKKLFGKFIKLPFIILLIALTAVMAWEATNLANEYIKPHHFFGNTSR